MTTREHASAAITQIHDTIRMLEGADNEVGHGKYESAVRFVDDARTRLYDVEKELRRAIAVKEETP
jgi:hypothetical protein